LYQNITSENGLVIEDVFDEAASDSTTTSDTEAARAELADRSRDDLARMVAYFYPWFELEQFYVVTVPATTEEPAVFNVMVAYRNNPDFRLTFFAERYTTDDYLVSEDPSIAYFDSGAEAWWYHPETADKALMSVFGPNPLMTESLLDGIAADFTAAHPGKYITSVTDLSNVDLAFAGIDASEIDSWLDDFESFESVWKLDMQTSPSRFSETSYEEF
jgi:hypothetical protein